jgi:nitrite reductase/ring-hydroxylating ferredoxin subunit/uncharacterized membrane protein
MPRRGTHSLLHASNSIHTRLERLGDDQRVDRAAGFLARIVGFLPSRGVAKDALSGTWLDHPVHPMLTDLPIGFWTSAMLLDFLPGAGHEDAARALIGAGVLCAIPTALTGAADWSDTEDSARRVGTVHAAANSGALVCYIASWSARRRGKHAAGMALGVAGASLATVGGLLGGHLVAALGVGVDRSAFDDGPADWTSVGDTAALPEGASVATVDGHQVLLVRHAGVVHAIAATCPHRGAPLSAGDVEGDVVTCSWHGSRFCVTDGALLAGPSPTPIRSYEARIRDDHVEIRATVTNR